MIPKYASWGKNTLKSVPVIRHHQREQKKLVHQLFTKITKIFRQNFRTNYGEFYRELRNLRSLFSPITTSFKKLAELAQKNIKEFGWAFKGKITFLKFEKWGKVLLKKQNKNVKTWFNPEIFFFCKGLETKTMHLSPKIFPQNYLIWQTPIILLHKSYQPFLREVWAGHKGTNTLKDNSVSLALSAGRYWKSEVKKLKSYSLLPVGWTSHIKMLKVSILPTVICKKYPQSIPGKIFTMFSGTKIQQKDVFN